MKTGPKPMPRNLRVITGSRERKTANSPANPIEEPPVKIPLPPDYLSPEEMDVFVVTARKLASIRVMTELDVDELVIYCRNWVESLQAQEKIRTSGQFITMEGSKGQKRLIENPFYLVRKNAEAVCMRIMADFGLNPSSRNRVSQ